MSKIAPGVWEPDKDPVELYNLDSDFTQAHDLSSKRPDKVKELQSLFWDDAKRYQVMPLLAGVSMWFGGKYSAPRNDRTHYEYLPGTENISPFVCPQIFKRSYTVSADLEVPETGANGAIMANADYLGGYGLYVQDRKPRFTYSFMGISNDTIISSDELPKGKVNLRYEFVSDKPGVPGAGGTSKLFINDKQVAEGRIEHTMAVLTTSYAGFDIGKDNGLPVSRTYESLSPFPFSGKINKVVFDLGPLQ
jgi:arylsulfatase